MKLLTFALCALTSFPVSATPPMAVHSASDSLRRAESGALMKRSPALRGGAGDSKRASESRRSTIR